MNCEVDGPWMLLGQRSPLRLAAARLMFLSNSPPGGTLASSTANGGKLPTSGGVQRLYARDDIWIARAPPLTLKCEMSRRPGALSLHSELEVLPCAYRDCRDGKNR